MKIPILHFWEDCLKQTKHDDKCTKHTKFIAEEKLFNQYMQSGAWEVLFKLLMQNNNMKTKKLNFPC